MPAEADNCQPTEARQLSTDYQPTDDLRPNSNPAEARQTADKGPTEFRQTEPSRLTAKILSR